MANKSKKPARNRKTPARKPTPTPPAADLVVPAPTGAVTAEVTDPAPTPAPAMSPAAETELKTPIRTEGDILRDVIRGLEDAQRYTDWAAENMSAELTRTARQHRQLVETNGYHAEFARRQQEEIEGLRTEAQIVAKQVGNLKHLAAALACVLLGKNKLRKVRDLIREACARLGYNFKELWPLLAPALVTAMPGALEFLDPRKEKDRSGMPVLVIKTTHCGPVCKVCHPPDKPAEPGLA